MATPASFCPVCAQTMPTHDFDSHLMQHDPKPEFHPEQLDNGRSYE